MRLAALLLSLAATVQTLAAAAPATNGPVIAFGDSITWGSNASINSLPTYMRGAQPLSRHLPRPADTSYPADLARLLDTRIYDYGLPGETIERGVPRLRLVLQKIHPRVVLLMEGTNDLIAARPSSLNNMATALQAMIRAIRAAHATPVVLTVIPVYFPRGDPRVAADARVSAWDARMRTIAAAARVPLIDTAVAFLEDPRGPMLTALPDGTPNDIHPDDAGYALLAQTVAAGLRSMHLIP